ncbi:MAG TPA: lipid-A-disaccharide synthase [Candidatus Kapabacteria bacterium]|nr:lipid-A-disaccharide synthase [Candidatus Kapabacteria bacterium]
MDYSSANILIIAGEASGDRHAARLVARMRAMRPGLRFWGIGGAMLAGEGVECVADAARMNVIGFVEVVKHYRFFQSIFNSVLALARERRPALAILVDYPGFNLRMARALHREGIRVVYYIAPQAWAWKEGRVRSLRENVDDLIVAFPFEVEYFGRGGINAHFFGHPLVDQFAELSPGVAAAADGRTTIAYLPGSRPEEIARHMPVLRDVMLRLGDGYRHVIPLASTIRRELIQPYLQGISFSLVSSAYEALAGAGAALVKSGTSTLEATLLGVPFAAFYRTSWGSYQIARRLIRVAHVAMPNVLAGRGIVREFVQDDMQAGAMGEELLRLLNDATYRARVAEGLAEVTRMLGSPGAAERIASYIVETYLQ